MMLIRRAPQSAIGHTKHADRITQRRYKVLQRGSAQCSARFGPHLPSLFVTFLFPTPFVQLRCPIVFLPSADAPMGRADAGARSLRKSMPVDVFR